jgi:hypothetical protein
MMKNNFSSFILAASLVLGASIGLAAEQAAIVAKVPLKATPSLLGGKVVRQLEIGILVNVLGTKGNFSQVELADDPSVKGWVQNIGIAKNKDVVGGVANMNAAGTAASDTKTRIAGSIAGVAKGVASSAVSGMSATSVKGKSASLKEDVGAVVKAKPKEAKEALEDAVGTDADDVMNAAAETSAKFKGKSASTLEKIEALKISETEISGFMKEGGLRSRLIR